jgi:signal transduction histidine kinase
MPTASRRLALIASSGVAVATAVIGGAALLAGARPSGALALSYALLAGFALAALLGLFLLIRLLHRGAELERTNTKLRAGNHRLRVAAEAKTRFVATVSHELKNPLAAMTGYAELLASGRWGQLSVAQLEQLGTIQAGGRHILALIEDLTDLARVECGQVAIRAEAVNPRRVLEACVTLLSRLAETRDVTVTVRGGECGGWVMDPTRLRQVVLNYLSNAIKFTPAGGRVELRLASRRGGLLIEVADRGPGITPEDRVRVFDEFFQVEGRSRSGSGLGLAVTRRIVEAQGGRVGVRSRSGGGSVFSAWIPARPATARTPAQPGVPESPTRATQAGPPPHGVPGSPTWATQAGSPAYSPGPAEPVCVRASRTTRRIPLSQRSG